MAASRSRSMERAKCEAQRPSLPAHAARDTHIEPPKPRSAWGSGSPAADAWYSMCSTAACRRTKRHAVAWCCHARRGAARRAGGVQCGQTERVRRLRGAHGGPAAAGVALEAGAALDGGTTNRTTNSLRPCSISSRPSPLSHEVGLAPLDTQQRALQLHQRHRRPWTAASAMPSRGGTHRTS